MTAHKVHPEQSNLKPKKPHTPIPQNLERNREAYTPPENTVTGSLESEGTHKDQSPTPWSFQDYLKLNCMALDVFCKISAAENLFIMGSNYSLFSFFSCCIYAFYFRLSTSGSYIYLPMKNTALS